MFAHVCCCYGNRTERHVKASVPSAVHQWSAVICEASERARIVDVVREIVHEVLRTEATGVDEHADRTLLYSHLTDYCADVDVDAEDAQRTLSSVGAFALRRLPLFLFGGLARVGWTVAHVGDGDDCEEVCMLIDSRLFDAIDGDWGGDFDYLKGLVGFGVYALERRHKGTRLAARVLSQLECIAKPRGAGLAWETTPALLSLPEREISPNGLWNLGIPHGTPGVVALLARYLRAGVEVDRARRLLSGGVDYLAGVHREAHYPRFEADKLAVSGDGRLAWCYGDMSVALALYAAAEALESAELCSYAHGLALASIQRPEKEARVRDACVCHGAAGVAHMFQRWYCATRDARFAAACVAWINRLLAMRNSHAIAGFPMSVGPGLWQPDATLLYGAAGVALALHAAVSNVEPTWDRLLLMDI